MAASLAQAAVGALTVDRIGYLALPVTDVTQARDFYVNLLGMEDLGSDRLPGCGTHALVGAPSGQCIALCEAEPGPDLSELGVHHGLRADADGRRAIAGRLRAAGVALHDYREDRAAEQDDPCYFLDPAGNRLQLVTGPAAPPAGGVSAIDHTAILVFDMLWAETFYVNELGLPVESRVGWMTADHARARRWAAGEEHMAPGTRRLDKLYMTMGGQNEMPRANMQIFLETGESMLALVLATQHLQEPPEEQMTGVPRTAFFASRRGLDDAAALLAGLGVAFEGPTEHPASAPVAAALRFKDPSSNFLELCAPRTS